VLRDTQKLVGKAPGMDPGLILSLWNPGGHGGVAGARDGDGVRGGWSDLLCFWTTAACTYTYWDLKLMLLGREMVMVCEVVGLICCGFGQLLHLHTPVGIKEWCCWGKRQGRRLRWVV